jgi:nicotinate-nucleotide adenylyltransferase
VIGLLGGAFDPPHNGHLAVARAALEHLPIDHLHVLVVAAPGHKDVATPLPIRLRLARAAFTDLPRTTVEPDEHARTVEALESGRWRDPLVVIGGDEWRDFATWREPERVLELARIAVATRPGAAVGALPREGERVVSLDVVPVPVSSTEVRERVRSGRPIDDLVPAPVAALIAELGLYRDA